MAGFKKRITHSVQGQLSLALTMAIIIIALISGGLTFASALDEAHELQDRMLRQMSAVVLNAPAISASQQKLALRSEGDNDARIFVDYLSSPALANDASQTHFNLPVSTAPGFHNIESDGETYRVLVTRKSPSQAIVIGQQTDVRDEIAMQSALRTLIPFSASLPVFVVVAVLLVRFALKPVTTLAKEVRSRNEQDLAPLPLQQVPYEILPFVKGINRLLYNIDTAMSIQKRFIADAAHELRTPITALTLQAERLSQSPMSVEASDRLSTLRLGLKRTKYLLEQLLTMARQQQTEQRQKNESFSVEEIFREILETVLPLALEKNIDIGVSANSQPDISLFTEKNTLYVALKNLVENAIKYIAENGQIDLSVYQHHNQVVIEVEDNGPGIDQALRERVFDAFYRMEGQEQSGSGLGLSIVRACIQKIGGTVSLNDTEHFQSGLLARITLPCAHKDEPSYSTKSSVS